LQINRSNARQYVTSSATKQQPHHIFVSSQPLTKAFSTQNVHRQHQSARQSDRDEQENKAPYTDPAEGSNGASAGEDSQGAPSEEDEFECPNNGIFADEPSGCQSYHVCQSGAQVQQKFQCPMGTLFNNIILTCDFAHNVQCGGKAKHQAAGIAPTGVHDQLDILHQPAPRASVQLDQASYPQQNLQQPRAQLQEQQQARWSHQQQQLRPPQSQTAAGPRPPQVGPQTQAKSQYNKHQQVTQSTQAQAVGAYPHPKPIANNLDDDSDDEPISPLVPATIPPRAAPLPYNPPPAISQTPPNRHSAHRSHYPNQLQHQAENSPIGNYDGASIATPVFLDPKPTESTTSSAQYSDKAVGDDSQAQTFNLVINHGTPTLSKQPSQQPQLQQNYQRNANPNQIQLPKQLTDQSPTQTSIQKAKEPRVQQKTPQSLGKQLRAGDTPKQKAPVGGHRSGVPKRQRDQLNQHSTRGSYDSQRQQMATQPKPVHVDGIHPSQQQQQIQQKQPPLPATALVDLTNDKRAGVSSEALNDGLVLIVRHGSGSSQIQVGLGMRDRGKPADYKLGKRAAKQLSPPTGSRGGETNVGQAFALDPAAVRPDSPVDAQLFPNVQQALAAQSSRSAATSHRSVSAAVRPAQASAAPKVNHVAASLPPLEPPKAAVEGEQQLGYSGESAPTNRLQLVAASPGALATFPSPMSDLPVQQATTATTTATQGSSQTKRVSSSPPLSGNTNEQARQARRSKRLRAVQAPTQQVDGSPSK